MSLSALQDFIERKRSSISIITELSGLAVAVAGLIWIGGMKERVERLDRQMVEIAHELKSLNDKVIADLARKSPPSALALEVVE